MNLKKTDGRDSGGLCSGCTPSWVRRRKEDGKGAGRKEKDRCRHYAGLLGRNHGVCQGRSQKTGP